MLFTAREILTHHWGYVSAIGSALLFGISSTLNKIALADVNPTAIAGMVYFVGGIVLLAVHVLPLRKKILKIFETPGTEANFSKRDIGILTLVIVCGSIVAPFLLLNGLSQTTAINASLLLSAEAFFTFLVAFTFLNERCRRKEYLGIVLLLVGVVFVTTSGTFQGISFFGNLAGNVLIISACLFWGLDNNLSKFLSKKRDLLAVTALKCFVGVLALLILSLVLGFSFSIPLAAVPYLLSVGAFSIAFSIMLFLFALRKLGSMRTGVIFSTSSLFGAALAFVVLGEDFTLIQVAAGLIMILGVYVIYRCRS